MSRVGMALKGEWSEPARGAQIGGASGGKDPR